MFYQQFLQFLIIFELFILFKFQGDQMCLKKVLKMAIMALTGYVEKFFVNSEVKVEINDENYTRKKTCLSDSFEIFLISDILTILK